MSDRYYSYYAIYCSSLYFESFALNITTAYLYGEVDRDIYLKIPKGIELDSQKYPFKLNKAIYGLQTSLKRWRDKLKEVIAQEFLQLKCERCVYYKISNDKMTIIATYVDDILLVSNDDKDMELFFTIMKKNFKVKIIKQPKVFIGMELNWETNLQLTISQKDYMEKISRAFGFNSDKEISTPMETNWKLPVSKDAINNHSEFRAYIGSFLYVSRYSRPVLIYLLYC